MYAAKKGQVAVTPPYKPALEEKLAFGLFHHPELEPFWEQTLTAETRTNLGRLFPRTWILDPQPVPPTAVIPSPSSAGGPYRISPPGPHDSKRTAAGGQTLRILRTRLGQPWRLHRA